MPKVGAFLLFINVIPSSHQGGYEFFYERQQRNVCRREKKGKLEDSLIFFLAKKRDYGENDAGFAAGFENYYSWF